MDIQFLLAMALPFLTICLIGKPFIGFLKRLNAGQSIREDGPQSHLSKSGTPVMGGILFLGLANLYFIFFSLQHLNVLIFLVLSNILFAFVGFLDDYIKVVKKQNLGLRAKQKIIGQFLAAGAVIFLLQDFGLQNWRLPFSHYSLSLGMGMIPILFFIIIGTVNSTNLTDGIDGLLGSVSLIVFLSYALLSHRIGNHSALIFAMVMASACAGFLVFNWHPAKVFMGDVGSLGIGGAVVGLSLMTKTMFFLPLMGFIYFAEAISVILQVISFKSTGKRIFKMAPLHHHFELCGWSEKKIVFVFVGASLIFNVIAHMAI